MIKLLIASFNLLTPVCIALSLINLSCLILNLPIPTLRPSSGIFSYYAAADTLFYLAYLHRRRNLRAKNEKTIPPSPRQRARLWKDAMRTVDREGKDELERWLRGWFIPIAKAPIGLVAWVGYLLEKTGLLQGGAETKLLEMVDIKRGNIEEWLSGVSAVYSRKAEVLTFLLVQRCFSPSRSTKFSRMHHHTTP